ncbi:MAG: hypothetical protein ACI8PP_002440, partial [Candidatus Pseudothioglobus sp.]
NLRACDLCPSKHFDGENWLDDKTIIRKGVTRARQ